MHVSTVSVAAARPRPANLFDVLRLVAASMVIVGHSWSLLGLDGVPTLAGITIHHLGVYVFFAISGFLLSTSWVRSPRPGAFMIRRCLRIFPALFLVVLATVFAIGPALTTRAATDYWGSSDTWQYLLNLTLVAQYDLPGVFAGNDQTAVNGSLWSLGPEFCCYLMVMILGLLGIRLSFLLRTALGIAMLVAVATIPMDRALRITATAVVFFIAGSLLARVRDAATLPLWPALLGVLALVPLSGTAGTVAASVVIPYSVVAVGSRTSRLATVVRRLGDPSYGIYLWGFPIQQAIISAGWHLPLAGNIAVVLLLSATAGYASWHLLEKHAISIGARLSRSNARPPVAHSTRSS